MGRLSPADFLTVYGFRRRPSVGGGVFALDLQTGRQIWHVAPPKPSCAGHHGCSPAQMAPPTLIPGILFAGSLDGHLRVHDTRNGQVIWDFDTAQDFKTTNGVHAHGGSLNGAGPAILHSMLFVNTGYTNAMAGNVLLEDNAAPTARSFKAAYHSSASPADAHSSGNEVPPTERAQGALSDLRRTCHIGIVIKSRQS